MPEKGPRILCSPMHLGKLIWQRSEWRKSSDTIKRYRRPRYLDPSECIERDLHSLRIVGDDF